MLGQMSTDTVCLTSTDSVTCVPNMDIFEVTSVYGDSLYGWNGILGLAPDQDGAPPSFVKAMKTAGLIDSAKMTFWL